MTPVVWRHIQIAQRSGEREPNLPKEKNEGIKGSYFSISIIKYSLDLFYYGKKFHSMGKKVLCKGKIVLHKRNFLTIK